MRIYNIKNIQDNGEFITIATECSLIHLPIGSNPSITVRLQDPGESSTDIQIDFEDNELEIAPEPKIGQICPR